MAYVCGDRLNVAISDHQQRWPRPLPGAILIPPALLVVADFALCFRHLSKLMVI